VIAPLAGNRATRLRELELRLAEFDRDTSDSARPSHLRLFLEASGPVFAAFGRYLSSRLDIVPESLCQELAKIPDSGPPSDPDEVRSLFAQEVGCPPARAFASFNAEPFESRLFWQGHHASLGGREVTVKIIHPEIGEEASDGDLLSLLDKSLTASGMTSSGFKNALADFQSLLQAAQTFEAELEAARLLAQDAQRFAGLGDQRVYTQLSRPHIAVVERWRNFESLGGPAPDVAQSFCAIWLQQCLRGSAFPIEPLPENAGFAADGRIVFANGPFATLSEALKANLWNYLAAVAAENADDSVRYLAAALGVHLTDRSYERLQRNIRQMVPFRDGFRTTPVEGWPLNGQRFAEKLLIHWRIASQNCPMGAELIAFYRGLFAVAQTAQKLAPDRDSLAEALRDLRLMTAFDEVRDVLQPSRLTALLESYAEAFLGMPQQMDRFLTAASTGMTRVPPGEPEGKKTENAENRFVRTFCLLLVLGAAGMLVGKAAAAYTNDASAIPVVIFFAFGLYVLRASAK
jgi:predicted unusual protein kinase regulating ubiquinone biosynthesis (AarF/ABC1/UbiB family)